MMDASQIREHMNVVGTNGQPIGTVDRVEGNRIKLTKGEASEHRYIELSEVSEIKNGEVCVSGNHSMYTAETKTGMSDKTGQPGQVRQPGHPAQSDPSGGSSQGNPSTPNQNGGQPGQNQMERRDQDRIAQSQGRQSGQGEQVQKKSGQNGEFGKHVGGPGKAQQMNQNGEVKPAVKGSANPGDKRG